MGTGHPTFPLRVAVRRTGLSAERIRAWETRYGAVEPIRTAGGSRRYREADLERLELLRAAVTAGHRIGDVARLESEALRSVLAPEPPTSPPDARFEALWEPLARLDSQRFGAMLDAERARRGDLDFACSFALPLMCEIGRRWEQGLLSVSAEHLASHRMMGMLADAIRSAPSVRDGATIAFATPPGERHELGLFVAALAAAHAGAHPLYLGADVPEDDLVASVLASAASVLALGVVVVESRAAEASIRRIRARLPSRIAIWLGGSGLPRCAPIPGVERIANLGQLASFVALTQLAGEGTAS